VPWVLAGLAIFLLGGFGAETAKGAIASELSTQVFSRGLFLGLKGDKGTQRHTAQDFETIEGTKNREPQSSSPNEYVP
jgi:hypothetical protein